MSLGGWNNFDRVEFVRELLPRAFDLGITHFDFANNYGPPPGIAEINAGKVLQEQLSAYRDELIISTKAGYDMWPGPYGNWGSRKYLLASLDQSLKRLQLDYVDIFYSHRYDPQTPLEETMGALDQAVRSGKALYAGISNYGKEQTQEAARIMARLGTPLLIHQCNYSMLRRDLEKGVLAETAEQGLGMIVFSPLAQGLLTNKYLNGIPVDSRAGRDGTSLKSARITPELIEKVRQLNGLAQRRGQSLARMALTWAMRDKRICSVIVGASRLEQLEDSLGALNDPALTEDELVQIEQILS
jgi:L-glyceraldehyde 3-phosphate reductase